MMTYVGVDVYNLTTTGSVGRTVTKASGGLNEHIPVILEIDEEKNLPFLLDSCTLLGYNVNAKFKEGDRNGKKVSNNPQD